MGQGSFSTVEIRVDAIWMFRFSDRTEAEAVEGFLYRDDAPSAVSAVAATSCLVQIRFPCACLTGALRQSVSGDEASGGIIGDRVPAWDLSEAYTLRRGRTLLLMDYACSAVLRRLRCRF